MAAMTENEDKQKSTGTGFEMNDLMPYLRNFLRSCQDDLGDQFKDQLTINQLCQLLSLTDQHGGTFLHWAARNGLVDVVEYLANNLEPASWKTVVKTCDDFGNTLLHYACRGNYIQLVKLLLDKVHGEELGKLVLTTNQVGVSALHWACRYGEVDIVRVTLDTLDNTLFEDLFMLLDDDYGTTSIHWACRYDKPGIVRLLLKCCPSNLQEKMVMHRSKDSALDDFCPDTAHLETENAYGCVRTGSITDRLVLPKTNGGSTAFHWACLHGHDDVVKVFAEELDTPTFKKLMDARDTIFENTVLHWISGRGHVEVLQVLMSSQKSNFKDLLRIKSKDGNTAFHWACGRGNLSVFNRIADEIKDLFQELIMETNVRGESALHWACNTGHHQTVAGILKRIHQQSETREALPALTDRSKCTALHVACRLGRTSTVIEIFKHMPPEVLSKLVQIKDAERRWTALHWACEGGYADIVKQFKCLNSYLLLKLIADNDNKDNKCAIETVILHKQFEIMSVLLSSEHALFENILQKIDKSIVVDACRRGENEAVLSLLKAANISDRTGKLLDDFLKAEGDDGKNVLHIACNRRDSKLIKELLPFLNELDENKLGPNVHSDILCHTDNLEKTVLLECSQRVDEIIVQMILDSAAKFHCVPKLLKKSFWDAFEAENYTVVTCVLKQAIRSDCIRDVLFCTDSCHKEQTVIHRSCQSRYGDIKCLKAVIETAKKHELLLQLLCREDIFGRTFLSYTEEVRSDIFQILIGYLNDLDEDDPEKDICHWFLTNPDKQNKTVLHTTPANRTHLLCNFMTPLYKKLSSQGKSNERTSQSVGNSSSSTTNHQFQPPKRAIPKISPELEEIVKSREPSDFPLVHNDEPFAHGREDARVSLLNVMGTSRCLNLIQHNYTQAYLKVCWRRYVLKFFLANSVLYASLLFFVTGFVVSHSHQVFAGQMLSKPVDPINSRAVTLSSYATSEESPVEVSMLTRFTEVCQYGLLVTAIMIATNEILQMFAKGRHYCKTPGNYADIGVTLGSLIISLASFVSEYQSWTHQVGVVTMCVAWMNGAWMITLIGFPKINLMFVMLFRVIYSILLFLPVFVVFIMCMALSYYCLLQNQPSFENFGYSVMKSLTMTVGEMEFVSIFFPDNKAQTPPFYVLTCFLFVVFLGIMNIAVINLLVGRAVGDIQKLNSQSEVVAFKSMVDMTKESQAMEMLIEKIKFKFNSCRVGRCRNQRAHSPGAGRDALITLSSSPNQTTQV